MGPHGSPEDASANIWDILSDMQACWLGRNLNQMGVSEFVKQKYTILLVLGRPWFNHCADMAWGNLGYILRKQDAF